MLLRQLVRRVLGAGPVPVLNTQSQQPLEEIDFVGVAIANVVDKQLHVGILHKQAHSNEVNMLHLAWHMDLRNEAPKPKYRWVKPTFPSARLRQVAARCRQILRANPHGIPYAFSQASDCFDNETREYLIGPTRHGLTCATFVVAVFNSVGLDIIQSGTWPPPTEDDRRWQEGVVRMLAQHQEVSNEHLTAVGSEVGGIRIRPEQVAAAVGTPPHPATYVQISEVSQTFLEQLLS